MTNEVYSRRGNLALKKESVNNTAVIPDTFVYYNDEDISFEFPYVANIPVAGNRIKNISAIDGAIPAPSGSIKINVEPKTFGHFLAGVFGSPTSGQYMPISSASGAFTVGETITGSSSSKTATVAYNGNGFLILTTPSGAFTVGETITGSSSSKTATVVAYDATVYGHAVNIPSEATNTYTLQFSYLNNAIRYFGVKFTGIDAFKPEDNVMTCGVKVMAQSMFRHAKVMAVSSSGTGDITIALDQTAGLVVADVIKAYRPSTDTYLDFSDENVKTHSIKSIDSATQITITNLETDLAVGDLIVLAPLTPTYSTAKEFIFSGGATVKVGAGIDTVAEIPVEEISVNSGYEWESRHGAQGSEFADRFPMVFLQKSFEGTGEFKMYYQNEKILGEMRTNTMQAVQLLVEGAKIGSTSIKYTFKAEFDSVQWDGVGAQSSNDSIMDLTVPFTPFYSASTAKLGSVLLVNEVASF